MQWIDLTIWNEMLVGIRESIDKAVREGIAITIEETVGVTARRALVRGVPVDRDAGVTAGNARELFLSGLRGRECRSAGHPDQDMVDDIR